MLRSGHSRHVALSFGLTFPRHGPTRGEVKYCEDTEGQALDGLCFEVVVCVFAKHWVTSLCADEAPSKEVWDPQ